MLLPSCKNSIFFCFNDYKYQNFALLLTFETDNIFFTFILSVKRGFAECGYASIAVVVKYGANI